MIRPFFIRILRKLSKNFVLGALVGTFITYYFLPHHHHHHHENLQPNEALEHKEHNVKEDLTTPEILDDQVTQKPRYNMQ